MKISILVKIVGKSCVDASTDELNPLVCITFILTAYHARDDTEDC